MKLPFRSEKGKDKPVKAATAKESGTKSAVSLGLRSQMLLLMLVGVLLAALPPLVVYMQTEFQLRDAGQQHAEQVAGLVAGDVRQWVKTQAAMAERAVNSPELARIMEQGDESAISAQAEQLTGLFPAAVRVRLLPPGIDEVDLDTSPPIGYAAIELLKYAETHDTPPPVEVHMAGTPQQHINLVRRILDPAGRRIVGHLMVSFPLQPLQEILKQASVSGYVELQQLAGTTPLVFATQGSAALKQAGSAPVQVKVSGSRWQIAYWPADIAGGSNTLLMVALGMGAGAAVLLLLLIWFVFRRTGVALRQDQATALTIVKDMRDGRVKTDYPCTLEEFHDTLELMVRTASAGMPAAPVVPGGGGQVDRTSAEAAITDEVEGDLLFDNSALEVVRTDIDEAGGHAEIFRAYDIRGIAGESLTNEMAYEIGRAIGSEAYYRGEQTIIVGRDGRLSGPDLTDGLIRGLVATGRDVKDIGMVPTPVLYFAAQYLGSGSGVMVTGSHNPADYNGFKVVLGGETLANEAIQALRKRIETGDVLTGEGSVEEVSVLPDYIERVKSDVQIIRPLKVVVDCGNGVAGIAAPQLLKELGCEVIELFCEVDGNFPNHHPDPGKTENLAALIQAVQENGAEIGIAFDGDGDRIGVVSSEGEIIWPDRLLMLLAIDVLARNPGAQIIYDVKSSRNVATIVAEHGGEPLMWATGHSLIKAKMKETGALLAGEMSGHIFFKERWFGFDDALYSAARLLEILANDARSSSDVFAELPNSVNTPELNVPMAEGDPPVFMEKLLNSAHFENARIATIDGMRVEFDRGWGLVRASNTTPCLVLRFEADDELALSSIQDEFRRVMLQVDPNLSLPF
ncbi:phosphomannomutase [Thiogranum longum]|uniref:phosphomannomutase n=1 Tax=Thiogranum longum TaxID=1537524 RepID=A0A4R1H7E4_9GAMM|nr:phosphomannomutase/phosphoglucomutase [Thiogranum longum]TCK17118.1 phosphomannomutase [Thiogranum longum]